MSLEENVNRWLSIDNKIKEHNHFLKELRETRNDLEENISNYAKENNITNLSIKTNEGLLKLKNVFLLPHLGSATTETREAMGMRVYENIKAFFQDEEPRDRVV